MWQCPNCETLNDGEACILCGEVKPREMPRPPVPPRRPPVPPRPPVRPIPPRPPRPSGTGDDGRLKFGHGMSEYERGYRPPAVPDPIREGYDYDGYGDSNTGLKVLIGLIVAVIIVGIAVMIANS